MSLAGLGLVLCATSARADILELTDKGAEALKGEPQGVVERHWDPPGKANAKPRLFVRGRIIILRDQGTDEPTLQDPGTFFIFRTFKDNFRYSENGSTWVASPQLRWEWSWIGGVTHEIDTIEDVRAILGNGDLRYGNLVGALEALRAEIDPSGQLGLRPQRAPRVSSQQVVKRDGWFSRFLREGPYPPQKRTEDIKRKKALPKEDPAGYSPVDAEFWDVTPESCITSLLESIARCKKYGEPDKWLKDYCLLTAQFICETLANVPQSAESGSDGARARRARDFAFRARTTLLSYIEGATPEAIADLRQRPAIPSNTLEDQLRHSSVDSNNDAYLRLDVFDMAQAAIDVLAMSPSSHAEDKAHVVEALMSTAASAKEFVQGNRVLSVQDATGGQALNALSVLAQGKEEKGAASGEGYREELVTQMANAQDAARAMVAKTALLRAGIGSAEEVERTVDALFDLGVIAASKDVRIEFPRGSGRYQPSVERDPRRQEAIDTLKRIANRTPAALRDRLNRRIGERLRELNERQKLGTGGAEEKRFLDQWSR